MTKLPRLLSKSLSLINDEVKRGVLMATALCRPADVRHIPDIAAVSVGISQRIAPVKLREI